MSLGHLQTIEEQIDVAGNRRQLLTILTGGLRHAVLRLASLRQSTYPGYGVRNRARIFRQGRVGASRSDIGRRIARDVLGILAIGTAAGVLMSLGTGRLAASALWRVAVRPNHADDSRGGHGRRRCPRRLGPCQESRPCRPDAGVAQRLIVRPADRCLNTFARGLAGRTARRVLVVTFGPCHRSAEHLDREPAGRREVERP